MRRMTLIIFSGHDPTLADDHHSVTGERNSTCTLTGKNTYAVFHVKHLTLQDAISLLVCNV